MADVQFELTGDTNVQGTMTETAAGALLCEMVLPPYFDAAHNFSLRLTCPSFHIQESVGLAGSNLHHGDNAERAVSVLLSRPRTALRLDDVLGHQLSLSVVDMNGRTIEVVGELPTAVEMTSIDCMDDELLFRNSENDNAAPEAPNRDKPLIKLPPSGVASGVAFEAARHYDDDLDDTFILNAPCAR